MMTYVHDYIWYVLGGSALIAFLLAWIIRGAMSAGKRRRATVDRDIALTELEQVRNELDSLYAAQRKQKEAASGAVPANMEGEIRNRDEQIKRMSDELASAKASLQSLREGQGAPAATAGAADTEALKALEARNSELQAQVEQLQAKMQDVAAAPVAVSQPAEEGGEGDADDAKLIWQVDYLKSRVAALEEQLVNAEPAPAAASTATADTSAADEEVARLRWRNRYLEGRLAYFEERPESEAEADDGDQEADNDQAVEVAPVASDAANDAGDEEASEDDGVHPADRVLEALGADEDEADVEDEPIEPEVASAEEDETPDEDAAEDVEYEGVRPVALDSPNGNADDLTLITGIGPRIQTILNDYGIWHFSQIADWSPENEAWIDRELNFAGRVSREGWIGQARELAGVTSDT